MRVRRSIRIALNLSLVLALVLAIASTGLALTAKTGKFVEGKNGAVAAAHPLAAEVGLQILKKGGNAVDAAVATAFAIGVVEPQASGLGGEGMMVVYMAKKDKASVIDYKSAIPASSESLGTKRPASSGYQSVGIPGTVAGLTMALKEYGTMSLAEVIAPAVRLAEEGFPCGETLASVIADNYEKILKDAGLASVFLQDELPKSVGDIIRNPELAKTLQKIAKYGPEVFYKGEIAEAIDADMKANGGFLSKEDLAWYQAIQRFPIRSTYRDYAIISTPPPVTSVALLGAMNVMENFDVKAKSNTAFENVHVIAEAIRQANIDRRVYVGDPDFMKIPIDAMLSKDYAKSIAGKISFEKLRPAEEIVPGDFGITTGAATGTDGIPYEHPSTTHISVVDKHHNMVALTQTLSSFFGAGVMMKGTGIIMNNEMGNVYGAPTSPAGLQAHKRIITTISPSVVLKAGKPYISVGTPGATRIMTTMAILFSNLLDHNMPLDQAINAPRFHPNESNNIIDVEGRMPVSTVEKLKAIGYQVNVHPDYDLFFGGVQGVMIDGRRIYGAADPRRDGAAAAY